MRVTLETLELTPEELEACREAVRKLAYFKWLDAGCPAGADPEFWLQAEAQWIGNCYVPARRPDGWRPKPPCQPARPAGAVQRVKERFQRRQKHRLGS